MYTICSVNDLHITVRPHSRLNITYCKRIMTMTLYNDQISLYLIQYMFFSSFILKSFTKCTWNLHTKLKKIRRWIKKYYLAESSSWCCWGGNQGNSFIFFTKGDDRGMISRKICCKTVSHEGTCSLCMFVTDNVITADTLKIFLNSFSTSAGLAITKLHICTYN